MAHELVKGEEPDALSLNDNLAEYLGLEEGPIREIEGGDADFTDSLGEFLLENGIGAQVTGGAPVIVVEDFEAGGAPAPVSLRSTIVRKAPQPEKPSLSSSIVRAEKN